MYIYLSSIKPPGGLERSGKFQAHEIGGHASENQMIKSKFKLNHTGTVHMKCCSLHYIAITVYHLLT